MSQRNFRHHSRGHQIATQQAGNGLSVFFRDRRKKPQGIGTIGIPLPPQAHDGETVPQQPRVARVAREVPVAAVNDCKNDSAAAVRHFQNHRTVALVCILRADSNEVRRELDLAVLQVHRVAEVHNALVVRVGHRKREVDASGNALIGSRVAECLAIENIGAGSNFDANYPRVERKNS